jgi:hypothetical protein
MIWGCISWFGPDTITAVDGNIDAIKYQDILEGQLWPVVAQHFPQGATFFKTTMPQSTVQDRPSHTKFKLTWPA